MSYRAFHLTKIDKLVTKLFSKTWAPIEEALQQKDLKYPGVYVLAFSHRRLGDRRIKPKDVFYVGMSNSAGGVRQRLKQFANGIERDDFHSGAMRFFRDHARGIPFSKYQTTKKFYVASQTIPCTTNKSMCEPVDFRQMGHVTCLEHYVYSYVLERTGKRPILNKY